MSDEESKKVREVSRNIPYEWNKTLKVVIKEDYDIQSIARNAADYDWTSKILQKAWEP